MNDRPASRRRRVVLISLSVAAVALVAAATWVGVRGVLAKGELDQAVAAASALDDAISARDLGGAAVAADALSAHAGTAAGLMSDPVWRAAEAIPFLGPNLTATRVAATQAHVVAADAILPLLDTADTLTSAPRPDGAIIDLASLADAREPLAGAQKAVDAAAVELATIDTAALWPVVSAAVGEFAERIAQADEVTRGLSSAAQILPGMLGADGEQTILLMVQNNAELRTGGGITGTFLEVRADEGRVEIVRQADSEDFEPRSAPILSVPDSQTALYGDVTGRFVQNTSMTPDFTLTAELASAWWEETFAVVPDTVISIDPLVLRAVIESTGPVPTRAGPLAADDVVQRLLIDPYVGLSPEEQTTLFQDAALGVFAAVTDGVDPIALAGALLTPVEQGRVSVWTRDPEAEAVLAQTVLAGPAARHRADPEAFAVYLNDTTGGKMDAYLDVDLAIGTAACRPDGRADTVVTVTLESTAPADAATALPPSVTGGGAWGTPAGITRTVVTVAAPAGAFQGEVTRDGSPVGAVTTTDAGFPVSSTSLDLEPGESAVLTFRFVAAEPGSPRPSLQHTPMIHEPAITEADVECATVTP